MPEDDHTTSDDDALVRVRVDDDAPVRLSAAAKNSRDCMGRWMSLRAARQAITKASHENHKDRATHTHYRSLYGLTPADVAAMEQKQNGACAICRTAFTLVERQVDHDHSRKGRDSVRGLLCRHCNIGIGYLQDDPKMLRRALAYLTAYLKEHPKPS